MDEAETPIGPLPNAEFVPIAGVFARRCRRLTLSVELETNHEVPCACAHFNLGTKGGLAHRRFRSPR